METLKQYPLSPNPIFWSLQGEGHLRGFQMAFLRLAGCSVGCPGCDTNYKVTTRATTDEIVMQLVTVTPESSRDRWVWITGGEPTDHELGPLLSALRRAGYSIALATSGVRRFIPPVDWLSVSPHDLNTRQLYGSEVKLVMGLNGLDPNEWLAEHPDAETDFMYRYVQPLSVDGIETNLAECLEFIDANPNWSLSRQDHVYWNKP